MPAEYAERSYVDERGRYAGKFLGSVFGVMGLALLLSCLVAFVTSSIFVNAYGDVRYNFDGYWTVVGTVLFATLFVVVFNLCTIGMRRRGKGYLLSLIVFSVWVGILLSVLLLTGLSMEIAGEALLITAVAFFAMFLIGYFTKINVGFLGFLAMALVFGALGLALVSLIYWALGLFTIYNLIAQFLILVVICLFVAIDSRNLRKIASSGAPIGFNTVVASAYTLYGDFINVLFKVIYLLIVFGAHRGHRR